ncbi:MAG: class I SAM-dependent methyltransferase [Steroidobacteraceae bacterium]
MKATACRGCGSVNLVTLHDFGPQPLAGEFPVSPHSLKPVRKYPLDLTQCRQCGLLQVVNLPPIEEVFHDEYRYASSTVPGLVKHFEAYADWLTSRFAGTTRVFEFGCNDGILLERLQRRGFTCAGIDASDNVASLARGKGLAVATGFLDAGFVLESGNRGKFDLVTCSNVFAHIHDVRATLDVVRLLLVDGGVIAIEVHDGELIFREGQFDTIYHEHLTYFTEGTLRSLLERAGFDFVLCDRTRMHGGGLRMLARKLPDAAAPWLVTVAPDPLVAAGSLPQSIERCRRQLEALAEAYGPLSGYGAAGRSQMFINFTGTGSLFERVFDDSPLRQGRYIAGTDTPIVPYRGESGGCAIILAWNYAADIASRIRGNFGRVVTLLPERRDW